MARGEKPEDVNRDLYRPSSRAAARTPGPASTTQDASRATDGQAQAATTDAGTKPAAAAANAAGQQQAQDLGITPEDLQVLKRAKFDLSVWRNIPPSNRKAIVAQFKATQAEADRAFQQARQPANQPAAGQQPAQATQEAQDGATLPANAQGQPDASQTPNPTAQQTAAGVKGAAAAAPPINGPLGQIDPSTFVDSKDLETLRMLGGDDLADTYSRGISKAVGAVLQQVAPIHQMASFLIGEMERREWSDAVTDLKKQPGFEQFGPQEEQALREKAELLIRAAGDPSNYRFKEAVQDAAASLFKLNTQAVAQKQLLERRQASLRGSPDRGTGVTPATRTLDAKERNRQIFANLQSGMSPEDARAAVDGR